jgi:putative inorganic carbon (HCO3(-)) transporter
VEIWNRALYAIQDVPFTGWGLGTFREVIWVLYPLFTISPGTDLAHAHNVFLQVALDTGLPGLVAYLALLSVAGIVGWRMARRDETLRPLALGLLAGLAALHVYGLTDALAPGSKPGLTFWMALGLLAAMERLLHEEEAVSP